MWVADHYSGSTDTTHICNSGRKSPTGLVTCLGCTAHTAWCACQHTASHSDSRVRNDTLQQTHGNLHAWLVQRPACMQTGQEPHPPPPAHHPDLLPASCPGNPDCQPWTKKALGCMTASIPSTAHSNTQHSLTQRLPHHLQPDSHTLNAHSLTHLPRNYTQKRCNQRPDPTVLLAGRCAVVDRCNHVQQEVCL